MTVHQILRFFSRYFETVLVIGLILASVSVRLASIQDYPQAGESFDEYYYTLLGSSIITNGVPSSWSFLPFYTDVRNHDLAGRNMRIVTPNMDHPPLFAFFPGIVQAVFGSQWDEPLPLSVLRSSMLPLWVANTLLLYLIGKRYETRMFGVSMALFYAVSPAFVFSSRMLQSENLHVTLILLGLYAMSMQTSRLRNAIFLLLPIAAILTKVSGVFIAAALITDLFYRKDKSWITAVFGTLLGTLAVFYYGAVYDLKLFLNIMWVQSNRHKTMASLPLLLYGSQKLVNGYFSDGVMLLGKASLIGLYFFQKPRALMRSVTILFFFLCLSVFLSVGEYMTYPPLNIWNEGASLYGWYAYPFYPLALIAFTYLLQHLWKSSNRFGFAVLFFFLFPSIRFALWQTWQIDHVLRAIPNAWPIFFGAWSLLGIFIPKRFWKAYATTTIIVILFFSLIQSLTMTVDFGEMDKEMMWNA